MNSLGAWLFRQDTRSAFYQVVFLTCPADAAALLSRDVDVVRRAGGAVALGVTTLAHSGGGARSDCVAVH